MNELRELCAELWAVRRRLLPVVLGLCFGTLGLAVLMAFGDGFDLAMRGALAQSGESMLRWSGGSTSRPHAGQPAGRAVPITARDVEALRHAPGVIGVSPEAQLSGRVLGDQASKSVNVNIVAVGAEWAHVRGTYIAAGGRFLSSADETERRRVAVVGEVTARELFGHVAVIGRTVRVFDAPFTIVGILPTQSRVMNYGGDDDRKVIIPLTTAQAMRGFRQITYGLVRIDSPNLGRQREQEQRALLAARLQFAPQDLSALRVTNHATQAGIIRGIITGTRIFLVMIGVLGLLVAAVGVANMTFVLVEERIREIGLRMALGATPRQIRRRQLLETACVVVIGGGLGLALAAGLLFLTNLLPIDQTAKVYLGEPTLSLSGTLLITGILGVCAGIAGWHPAARAAAVEPVEALRHD